MNAEEKKYYVTMTDTAMSGWGCAKNRINKLIFVCDTYEEAVIVENNAHERSDMTYINICTKKPYYNPKRYLTQIKTIGISKNWYRKDFFLYGKVEVDE